MLLKLVEETLSRHLSAKPAKCVDVPDLDDPNRAHLDTDPSFDQVEMEEMMLKKTNPRRPPNFDSLMHAVHSITRREDLIKGFRFTLEPPLTSQQFNMVHEWNIYPPAKDPRKPKKASGYTASIQYVHGDIRTPTDKPDWIAIARTGSRGFLEAHIQKSIRDHSLQFTFGGSAPNQAQVEGEYVYYGDDFYSKFKIGNMMHSFGYMQTVTNNFAAGFDLIYMPMHGMSMLGFGGRYIRDNHSFYLQHMPTQARFSLGYLCKLNKKTQFVTDFSYRFEDQQTNARVGFRQKFTTSDVVTTLTSKWKLGSIITFKGLFYNLKLCASLDYLKDSYQFGYGIGLGMQQGM